MRITEIDLEIEDIEWYGIDEDGRIAQFTSGGSKVVPEFIMISDLPVSMQDILLKCKISNSNFSKNNTILIEGSY